MSEPFALLAIYKPKNVTSTDVLNKVKRHFGWKRVGHSGTLDPFAEGLLLLLIGKATRLAEYYQKLPKTYRAVGLLGVSTDTYDITGKILEERKIEIPPSREELENVLKNFVGEYLQTPPPFSAIKIKGKRAYKLARKGIKVELKPRPVKVYSLKLCSYNPPKFEIETTVSGGTYIRSLIRDIGNKLGLGATTESLIRTSIGNITLGKAVTLEELLKILPKDIENYLLPPDIGLEYPTVEVDESTLHRLRNGVFIPLKDKLPEETFLKVYANGKFAALGVIKNGKLKPEKVFV
jgi:tRNA pseudouridine55 synthase